MHLSTFIHQKSYEKIELLIRHHWFTFVPSIIFFVVLGFVPVVLKLLTDALFPGLFDNQTVLVLSVLVASIFYLSIALFFYTYFVTFYLDLLVITNDRLIEVTQANLFARTVSEMDLFRVQDVSSEVEGFFPSIFNYGDLIIQDASAVVKFKLKNIPNPNRLRQQILELAEYDRKFHAPQKGYMPG